MTSRPGPVSVVLADKHNVPMYVPPPFNVRPNAPLRADAIQITVNYNPVSCGANVAPWPANARTAFDYAVTIWQSILNGTQPIVVDACWHTDIASTVLGSAGASVSYSDFTGAPQASTYYPVPLANQLANTDLNGSNVEIAARFNANQPWYLGLDGAVPVNQYDLVTVVLHELGHGLGFAGGMTWDNGTGDPECNGIAGTGCCGDLPNIYDCFTQTSAGQPLLSLGNNTLALGNALISDAVYFNGPNANAATGNLPPRLHAPASWDPGTSYTHLREGSFAAGTVSALMTLAFAAQEAIHYPGPITLGIFHDMGGIMLDLTNIYVDAANTGFEDGILAHPFNTMVEGVSAVTNNGTVWIRPGTYHGGLLIQRPMIWHALNGTAIIGAP